MRSSRPASPLTALALLAFIAPTTAAAAAASSCATTRWVGVWESAPTDAGKDPTSPFRLVDASLNPQPVFAGNTLRATLTPSYGGTQIRLRLTNRFGETPTTFGHVTIAKRPAPTGAAVLATTLAQVTFDGHQEVTVPAGQDVLSDPITFTVSALDHLAVSLFLPQSVSLATRHAEGRQTSYVSPSGSGDETGGAAYTAKTTSRPFLAGIEVRAPSSVGAVLAVGDSLTDGAQNNMTGVLESPTGLDQDVRYPDWLARRLQVAGRPLSVLNAGISGNKLLRDGADGGNFELFGPSLLSRLDEDVLGQAGFTTVVLWSGINDVSQSPRATPEAVEAGYTQLIGRLHAAGLKVLQATLTPFMGYPPTLASGQDDEEAPRQAVNAWIRTRSPADAVVDFDAAIRDPNDPTRLAAAYDDGEHLHLTAAGYRRIADTIPLDHLADARCTRPLTVTLNHRTLPPRKLTLLRIVVRQAAQPAAGATVRFGKNRSVTSARGVAILRVRPRSAGRRTLIVRAGDGTTRRITLRVRLSPTART